MKEDSAVKSLAELLLDLRRYLLRMVLLLVSFSLAALAAAPRVLLWLETRFGQRLAFFGVAEPWLALLKTAFFLAVVVLFPYFLWLLYRTAASVFHLKRVHGVFMVLGGMLLFYAGIAFCFFVTLPYGMKFLLSFQKEDIVPTISVGHFVNFVALFLLAFGLIFELPLFMILLAQVGLLNPHRAARYRRHAILIITIVAAVLTPTPDVFNLSLMAVPLYLLFEVGLLGARLVARKRV
ncbi:twin-arginine translocase subunit TatC [Thermosulfurimonas sp. F29]|uniref:twin-arginine translocase subunit TatC n=1 Tax=Thermosulfurimonas sp. F29 TaxID=2867247 RepID=UPI001C838743|nr:twin-arginine translocase subunit TatC [Thermosulfurimonas sp. F29]MBX6423051.1 twin-arginine translocase subunit TatC [Thermosulfurimonas sp. F29]